jgi:hypothetical protein
MKIVPGTQHFITWKEDNVKAFSNQKPQRDSANISAQAREVRNKPMFNQWFSGSKALDEDGDPAILYHGTKSNFNSFDIEKSELGMAGEGFYFSNNPDVANKFNGGPGGNTIPAFLSIKNPFDMDANYGPNSTAVRSIARAVQKELNSGDPTGMLRSDLQKIKQEGIRNTEFLELIPPNLIRRVLEEAGYDGIVFYSGKYGGPVDPNFESRTENKTYVAFYPQQVKSIFNPGSWSVTPDIRGQVRAAIGDDIPSWMTEEEFARATDLNDPRLNDWFGEEELQLHRVAVDGRKLQKELAAIVGQRSWFGVGPFKYGEKARDIAKAIHIYIDRKNEPDAYRKYYDQLTDEQKRIADLAETEVATNAKLRDFADKLESMYEKAGRVAMTQGLIHNLRENFVGRVWRLNGRPTSEVQRTFGTTTRHRRRRKLPTIFQGWAEGLELVTEDAIENLTVYREELVKAAAAKNLIAKARRTKLNPDDADSPFLFTHSKPRDYKYEELKHPNFKYYVPDGIEQKGEITEEPDTPNYKYKGRKLSFRTFGVYGPGAKVARKVFKTWDEAIEFIEKKGNPELEIRERWENLREETIYAPAELADHLNKITDEGFKNKAFNTALRYNAKIKSIILMTSLFHHMAFMRSFWLGTPGMTAFDKEGNEFSKLRLIKAYKEGMRMVDAASPEIEFLIENGLTLGRLQDWDEIAAADRTKFSKWLDEKSKTSKKIKDFLSELRQRQTSFLFKNFGAGLKVQSALIEYHHNLKKYGDTMSKQQIAQLSARLINEDFGGLNFKRMGVSKKTQQVMRFLLLAPDWTGSNFLTIHRLAKNILAKDPGSKAVREIYRNFWTGVVMKGMLATILANLIMSTLAPLAGDEEDPIKRLGHAFDEDWRRLQWTGVDITPLYKMFQKTFNKQDDGRRRYFSIIGHFKDPLRWALDPTRSAIHKGSPISRVISEASTGMDWKGDGFTTFEELLGTDEAGYYKTDGPGRKAGDPKGGQLQGKLVDRTKDPKPISIGTAPSYLLTQIKGSTPVQVQEMFAVLEGQRSMFDAIGRSLGFHMAPGKGTAFDLMAQELGELDNELNALKLTDKKAYAQKRRDNVKKIKALNALKTYEKRIRMYKKKLVELEKNDKLTDEKKKELKKKYESQISEIGESFVEKYKEID